MKIVATYEVVQNEESVPEQKILDFMAGLFPALHADPVTGVTMVLKSVSLND